MRKFIKNWLKTERSNEGSNFVRKEPVFSIKNIDDTSQHTDEMFLDEDWENQGPQTTNETDSNLGWLSENGKNYNERETDLRNKGVGIGETEAPAEISSELSCPSCFAGWIGIYSAKQLEYCPFCESPNPNFSPEKYVGPSENVGFEAVAPNLDKQTNSDSFKEEISHETEPKDEIYNVPSKVDGPNLEDTSDILIDIVEPILGNESFSNHSEVDGIIDDELLNSEFMRQDEKAPHHQENDYNYFDPNSNEDWEIYLDEDLEESAGNAEDFYQDEDPLESENIINYATRLTISSYYFREKQRKHTLQFYVGLLGDFPFYQSYAAIERLLARGYLIDHIADTYKIKLMWACNPFLWSQRRYDRLENNWKIFINQQTRNSMSWQMASDLVKNYPVSELENLILVDWYNEWSVLKLSSHNSSNGFDPAFGLYSIYLNEKRMPSLSAVNTW